MTSRGASGQDEEYILITHSCTGRGRVIAEFLRKVLQARDDPLDLLPAALTMHREELCRNNLSKSSSITENEVLLSPWGVPLLPYFACVDLMHECTGV